MSRTIKVLLVTLLGGALLFGAVFGAAASINISGLEKLGGVSVTVDAPSDVTDVEWFPYVDDTSLLNVVKLTFTSSLPAGSQVYVQITDGGVVIAQWQDTNVSGSSVDAYVRGSGDTMVKIELIDDLDVTVITP